MASTKLFSWTNLASSELRKTNGNAMRLWQVGHRQQLNELTKIRGDMAKRKIDGIGFGNTSTN